MSVSKEQQSENQRDEYETDLAESDRLGRQAYGQLCGGRDQAAAATLDKARELPSTEALLNARAQAASKESDGRTHAEITQNLYAIGSELWNDPQQPVDTGSRPPPPSLRADPPYEPPASDLQESPA